MHNKKFLQYNQNLGGEKGIDLYKSCTTKKMCLLQAGNRFKLARRNILFYLESFNTSRGIIFLGIYYLRFL